VLPNNEPRPQQILTLGELRAAAVKEDWDAVDLALPGMCDLPDTLEWAVSGLDHENPNLRDLAASVFEKSSLPPASDVTERLLQHMERDDNPYARFRSAFALFRHGNRSPEVLAKLRQALEDEDVADIAQSYLDQLEKET